jgi:anti-sigma B factor antagonist
MTGKDLMMNMRTEMHGKIQVITIREERLDAHNSNDLKVEIVRLFESGTHEMLIDLKDVRFIDSSGLGVLVSGFKNASTRQGSLKLCSLQSQVKSMFELTRLHRVFDIFPSVDEALNSY